MIKVYHYYIRHSRLEKLLATNTDVIVFISGLVGAIVGKLAEYLTYLILITVAMVVPIALWLGIPSAVFMCFDFHIDTQWEVFALLGAFATWTVLCFLILAYLDRPGKPANKK